MQDVKDNHVVYLRLDDIIPNRFQPREIFDEPGLKELSDSIKEHGVIQPVIVRPLGNKYELIAGERRTKASAIAGLTTIPAIVRNMDDKESAKVSLLENLQRKNLSAIEEARTYKRILELDNITQEELARTMGRSQPMIANKLRLLALPEEIQDALIKNQISERHARSLLTLKDKKLQLKFLDRIKDERLTVRQLEAEIKKYRESSQYEDESNEIKNKEEIDKMNNNIGNFGGMGLNDYQSGVTNNMFYNTPNNFNNMPDINNNSQNNLEPNYQNFDDEQETSNNPLKSFFGGNESNSNNNQMNVSQNTQDSLGSMFEGNSGVGNEYYNDNMSNNSSNMFVSHIREDNLPKVENQFLPNFDTMNDGLNGGQNFDDFNSSNQYGLNNNSNSSMGANNTFDGSQNQFYGSNNQINSAPNGFNMNYNGNYNYGPNNSISYPQDINESNNYQIQSPYSNGMPNYEMNNSSQYNQANNMGMNFNQPNYSMSNGNVGNSFNQYNSGNQVSSSNNYFMNDLNNNYTNQIGMNNDFINNTSNSFNSNNYNNDFNSNTVGINYQPNQGGLFQQPLNIVDVPSENEVSSDEIPNAKPNENTKTFEPETNNFAFNGQEKSESEEENEQDLNIADNYLFNNQLLPKDESNEALPIEQSQVKENNEIPDIEVIGSGIENTTDNVPSNVENSENIGNEESKNKQDYIRLDPVQTINSTKDAVLELKKTTDLIKQNNIDIETEEIDFDDVYQITIKIKKTE